MVSKMLEKVSKIDNFLENYEDGSELKIYMTAGEKTTLEDYVHNHPKGGKDFNFEVGFFKGGFLEHDYRLRKRKK